MSRKMLILPNIKYFRTCFLKVSMRFLQGLQCTALPVSYEKIEKIVDCGGVFGALLTDLSKTFDCIPHELITAKLEAYGFQTDALNLVYDYLSNRKQRVKINETFICWKNIEYGVPQGSILGPLLFNIHLCDLFYFLEDLDIASYVDDTTIYTVKESKESVINTLETSSLPLFTWFNNNFMKANSDKSHIRLSCI